MELPGKQLTLLQDAVKYGKCSFSITILMLENTEGTVQRNWQHIGYTRQSQDEDKQIKNTAQYVLDTTMRKQIQVT